jgi:hypothetical protein
MSDIPVDDPGTPEEDDHSQGYEPDLFDPEWEAED